MSRYFSTARSSTAIGLVLSVLAFPVHAQVTQLATGAPVVLGASQIIADGLSNVGAELETIVSAIAVTETIAAGGLVVTSTVDANVVSAGVDGNATSNGLDLMLASGSTVDSNAVIASTLLNQASAAFGRIADATVRGVVTAPAASSSISVSGNAIASDVDLNAGVQTLQGMLNPDFANGEAGTSGPVLATATLTVVDGANAGLLVSSVQTNLNLDAATTNNAGAVDAFSSIGGTGGISARVDGAYGTDLSIAVDGNSVSAGFTGNDADNLIDVRAGMGTDLESAAGIVNVQNNQGLSTPSAVVERNAARITAVVDGPNTRVFEDGTLSFTGNAIRASGVGNLAENDLRVAAGIDVDAPNDGAAVNDVDADAGPEGEIVTSAGLFSANLQTNALTDISALVDGTNTGANDNDLRVDVVEEMLRSTIDASGNAISATALGNDASGSIVVGGAGSLDATVAASNLQIFRPSTGGAATGVGVSAAVIEGDLQVDLIRVNVDIADSTVTVEDNAITALAVANRDPLVVSLRASAISDEGAGLASTTVDNVTGGAGDLDAVTAAGLSVASVQRVGDNDDGLPVVSVTASAPDAEIYLDIGNGTTTASGSSLSVAGNVISTTANANEQALALSATADTTIDASSAATAVQLGDGLAVAATTGDGAGTGGARIRTDLFLSTGAGGASGNTIVVGDSDLSDGVFDGNSVASSAAGQINATSLEISAGTALTVTGAIDGATASLSLDATGATAADVQDGVTSSELSVLSDQRLTAATIAATTEIAGISARVGNGAQSFVDNTLAVDGNRVTAAARGNVTTNTLALDAASVDMSLADATGGAAGTNLATIGAAQDVAGGSAISASVVPEGVYQIEAFVSGDGDASGSTVSVDANLVSAFAAGSTASNAMALEGSSLRTPDAAAVTRANLSGVGATDEDLLLSGVALANGVLQNNDAAVSAAIADGAAFRIFSAIQTAGGNDVTGVTLGADDNTVLSQARGLVADAATSLDFSDVETSALVASRQTTDGDVSATTGAGGGSVGILADLVVSSDGSGLTLSAADNTVGAELIGATSTTRLSVEAANRLASGSQATGTTTIALDPAAGFEIDVAAEFAAVTQQVVGGALAAATGDVSIAGEAGDLADATVAVDANVITAQATGGAVGSALSLSGGDLAGADPANVAAAAVLTDQSLVGSMSVFAGDSSVSATVADLDDLSTGVNGSETVSVDDNAVTVLATGLRGSNALSVTSTGGTGGAAAGDVALDLDGSAGGELAATVAADRAVVTNQTVESRILAAAGLDPTAGTTTTTFTLTQVNTTDPNATASVLGDTLGVDGNSVLAQVVGATNANLLLTRSGGGSTASSTIVAVQEVLDVAAPPVPIGATVGIGAGSFGASMTLSTFSTVADSTLTASGNATTASVIGLSGANTLSALAEGSLAGEVAGDARADLGDGALSAEADVSADLSVVSEQRLGVAEIASLNTGTAVSLSTGTVAPGTGAGAVTGSTLQVDGNVSAASATGAVNVNILTARAENALDGPSALIAAGQEAGTGVEASLEDASVSLLADGAVDGGSLSASSNATSARASLLEATNTLSAEAGTGATASGDAAAKVNVFTANRGTTAAGESLATVDADRGILSDQVVTAGGATADGTDVSIDLRARGAVTGSTLVVEGNAVVSSASVARVTNGLANVAGGALDVESAVLSIQESAGTAAAVAANVDLALSVADGAGVPLSVADGALSLSENRIAAVASGLSGTNGLSAAAGTVLDGDASENRFLGVAGDDVSVQRGSGDTGVLEAFNLVVSVQRQTGDVGASVGENLADLGSGITLLAGAIDATTVAVDGNTVTAEASGIVATNTLTEVAGTQIAGGSAASVSSVQILGASAAAIDVEAAVTGITVSSTTGPATPAPGSVDASRLSVDGNSVVASARGATATNSLSASAATSMTGGSAGNALATTEAGAAALTSDGEADVGSVQVSNADLRAQVTPGSDGANPDEFPTITLSTGDAVDSTLTVDSNVQQATASNLSAVNSVSVVAGTELDNFISLASNVQDLNGGSAATVSGSEISLDALSFEGVSSTSGNLLAASASGATATNSVTASAATMVGNGGMGDLDIDVESGGTGSRIDFDEGDEPLLAVSSIQVRDGDAITASIADGDLGSTDGALQIRIGVTGDATGVAMVAENTLLAQARGLQATNTLSADIANSGDGAAVAVGNVQSTDGAVGGAITAAINPGVGADRARVALDVGGSVTGVVANDRNSAQAAGLANLAVNSASMVAVGGIGGDTEGVLGIQGDQDIEADGALAAVANGQRATTAVNATIDNLDVETTIGGALNGTATVEGNALVTDARNNYAVNSLSLEAGNNLSASAQVASTQRSTETATLTSAINAEVGASGRIGFTADGDVTGTVRVDDNTVQASAVSNQAINQLAARGGSLSSAGGGSATAGSDAVSDFTVLNRQENAADVNSSVSAFTVSAVLGDGGDAVSGSASVSGNMIGAFSAANVASNTLTLDAAGNARADAAIASLQTNTGGVFARVSGASVSMTASGATASGTFATGGNRISATAQGNVASSSLRSSGSSFSNR